MKKYNLNPIDITVLSGDVVALVGVKDTDISSILKRFRDYDPISQHNSSRRINGNIPTIQCIKSKSNLLKQYTAYENILLAEKCLIKYNKKQLYEICKEIKKRYRIPIDLNKN